MKRVKVSFVLEDEWKPEIRNTGKPTATVSPINKDERGTSRPIYKDKRGRSPSEVRMTATNHFKTSRVRPDALSYIVFSNNLPMGIAQAQYRLWKDKGADRFAYRTESARFVNRD